MHALGVPESVGTLVQAPAEQAPPTQSWHALPPVPHAVAALPGWQVRVASQQPEHDDGSHEGPASAVDPSAVAPSSPEAASIAAPSSPGADPSSPPSVSYTGAVESSPLAIDPLELEDPL
jgi:hypothetical protein